MNKIGYLGPPGTFSHTAAMRIADVHGYVPICCSSLESVVKKVSTGTLDNGIVPVENSLGGSVGETLDLLSIVDGVYVIAEMLLEVRQHLLVRPGVNLPEIKKIYSHPQALAQCRQFLREKVPGVPVVESVSTAMAALAVAGSPAPWAAIGSQSAAAAYGLQVLCANAQDKNNNMTRFLVLGKKKNAFSEPAKTSLVLAIKDCPGALYEILRSFALRQINLTRIESRPAGGKLGDYIFFIDLEGRDDEPDIMNAIKECEKKSLWVKVLGCYNAAIPGEKIVGKSDGSESMASLRQKIDQVDSEIMQLLTRRQSLVDRIAAFKGNMYEVVDISREKEIIMRVRELARHNDLDTTTIENIFRLILKGSVSRQRKLIAYNE